MTAVLQLRNIVCQRGDEKSGLRLEIPSFSLLAGEAIAVTGPSGCGKSTLLDLVGLALRPAQGGDFHLMGHSIFSLNEKSRSRLRAHHIGYILQTGGLLPFISVRDNIRLSLDLLGLPSDRARPLVETLGLASLLDKKPASLSIGERQRVAIARALAHRPSLVLADEPTASLDPNQAAKVVELMLSLAREMGLSLLIVSHDWDLLADFNLPRIEAELDADPESGQPITRFSR